MDHDFKLANMDWKSIAGQELVIGQGTNDFRIVKQFDFQGKRYLKSKENNVYDYKKFYEGQKESIGKWNDVKNKIDFNLDSLSISKENDNDNYDENENYILNGTWL